MLKLKNLTNLNKKANINAHMFKLKCTNEIENFNQSKLKIQLNCMIF